MANERMNPCQFHIIGVMKRLLDYYLERAISWQEFCDRHAEFVANYNEQEHFGHLDRSDGLRSPMEVLSWVKGRPIETSDLKRLFATEQVRRHVDTNGYVTFRYWQKVNASYNMHANGIAISAV
jgi:hypothetical protein